MRKQNTIIELKPITHVSKAAFAFRMLLLFLGVFTVTLAILIFVSRKDTSYELENIKLTPLNWEAIESLESMGIEVDPSQYPNLPTE